MDLDRLRAPPLPDPSMLSDLIGTTYRSAFEPSPWEGLIVRLTELFPGIGASVVGDDGERLDVAYNEAHAGEVRGSEASTGMFRENPDAVTMDARFRTASTVTSSAIAYPDDVWRAMEVYRTHLAPNGFHHVLHLTIGRQGARGVSIGVALPAAPEAHARIHDPLHAVLTSLAPHAARAFDLAQALARARRSSEVTAGVLDAIVLPVVVADAHARLVSTNAAGRRMMDRRDPFRTDPGGRLALRSARDTGRLRQAIRDCVGGRAQAGLRVADPDAPLVLAVTPFRAVPQDASAYERDMLGGAHLYAIFVSASGPGPVNARLLQDAFGLTPREAEVCQALLAGESPAAIAAASGRSEKTIRNQVQSIHEKVGVPSNVALLHALAMFRTVGGLIEDGAEGR